MDSKTDRSIGDRLLTAVALLATVTLGATAIWALQHERPAKPAPRISTVNLPLPLDPVSLTGAIFDGDERAPVVLLQFSEFQCPYCAAFAQQTLPTLRERYIQTGQVRMAFRHFPLETIHAEAMKAAEGTACAVAAGKFWLLHDTLFSRRGALRVEDLGQIARRVGLDGPAFDACLDGRMTAQVREDIGAGLELGVSSTPSFFLGRVRPDGQVVVARRLAGALPLEVFTQEIDQLLSESKTSASNTP
jgi:protein-disulfide isomerase